jgi:peptidoglycan/LPS O-acetylase OafA/YrhL
VLVADTSRGAMSTSRYWPSLDGVRGVAIALVVAYHLGYLGGGWIGVDVFFVLSGFLITSLLLDERTRSGIVRLRAFWARRARRLLPALLVLVVAIAVYAWAGGTAVVPAQLRSPAVATLFYFANWQQVIAGHSYFAQFQAPSPLQHTWSLAIEEQYYLLWPLLFLALARLLRSRPVRVLVFPMAALAAASALWMGVAAHVFGADRAYLGTDTRAWELLLGGMGAVILASPRPSVPRPRTWALSTAVAAAVVATGVAFAAGPPAWVWDGGLVAVAAGALVVVMGCAAHPDGPVARALSWRPLRGLGLISYSLYLWHWPVIVVLSQSTTGLSGSSLLTVRLAVMLGASVASYFLVERPLRRANWSGWRRRTLVPATACGVVGIVLAATVPPVVAAAGLVRQPPAAGAMRPATSPGSPATTSTTTVPAPVSATSSPLSALADAQVVSSADPLRVWLFGDSVMADSAPGITAALQATGDAKVVADSAFGGWGLTSDPNFVNDSARVIAQYHPQVVIGTWSWDDLLARLSPGAYLIKLTQALQAVLSPGNGVELVVLLQFPQTGPSPLIVDPTAQRAAWASQDQQQTEWNNVARAAVQLFPGRALYLQTQSLFAPGDRFFAWNKTSSGAWLRARKVDNTHMCPFGAAEFGSLLVNELTPVLELAPMSPGWELGAWTHDANYNDPVGSCPDDQPPPGYDGVSVPGPPS